MTGKAYIDRIEIVAGDKPLASHARSRGRDQWIVDPRHYVAALAYHIKDTGMGAMVWKAKAAMFWMKSDEQVAGPYWLVAARDRLEPETIK